VSNQNTLKFAVMLQNNSLKQWQFDVIEKLVDSGLAKPVLLIFNDDNGDVTAKTKEAKPPLLWRVYEKMFLRKGPLANVDLPVSFESVPQISCKVEKKGRFSQYFSGNDIIDIQKYSPDFILRFGFSIIRGDILQVAPYGVWSFHHSDEQNIRGGPAGFWEVYSNHSVNGVILQKLTNHLDGGHVLDKRFYKTILHDCAFHIHHVLHASTDMPVNVCRSIISGNTKMFQMEPVKSHAPVYSYPSSFIMLFFALKQMYRRILFNIRDVLFHEKWSIGIAKLSFEQVLNNDEIPKDAVLYSYNKRSEYPADPFALPTDNGLKLIFERYSYRNGKAGISVVNFDENHGFSSERVLTKATIHRSFPFVLQHEGRVFVLPEQIEAGNTQLFEWNIDENTLSVVSTITDKALADPVLLFHDNLWWLFGSPAGNEVNNCLQLFFSDSLEGPFVPHPMGNIVFDPRGARMAGHIVKHNGELFRLAQQSDEVYGKRTVIYKILHLNTTSYSEVYQTVIEPMKTNKMKNGIHTVNFYPPFVVFDGKKRVISLRGFKVVLKQRSRKR
jgi:hypothetical protein